MATQVGTVQSVTGAVKAVNENTGEERILTVGSPVYQGESIQTLDTSNVLISMKNGELVTLGRSTTMVMSDDVVSSSPIESSEATVSQETINAMLANGDINLDALNLDELEETATGEESSANEGGVTITRLGLEGNVTSGFDTSGLNGGVDAVAPDSIFGNGGGNGGGSENSPPKAFITDDGSRLIGLIGSDAPQGDTVSGGIDLFGLFSNSTSITSPLFGGSGNSPIELGALDVVNYQPKKEFRAEDKDDDIQYTEMRLDNGVGQDLLGLSKVIGNNEFDAPENDPTYNYDVSDDGQTVTVTRKDGQPMTEDEANAAMDNVEIKDSSLLGSLLSSGVIIGGTYGLTVEDSRGEMAEAFSSQFLDINLLQNGTGSDLTDLIDVPVLDGLSPVTDIVDDLLGDLDNQLLNGVGDLLGGVEDITAPLDPVLTPVGDLVNQIGAGVVDLTDTLGESTPLGDPTIGQAVSDIGGDVLDGLLNIPIIDPTDPDGILQSLLGGEPNQDPDSGSVDDLVDGVTNLVDGIVGTDSENLDDGLNAVTTDVQDLLTGEQNLEQVVGSLLGGEPDEAITAGSVDQVVDGATDVVDDLTAGLGLPTDTENLDDGLNAVTTDVEDLLTGEQSLEQVVGSLLGGEPDEAITAGSVDQVVDGATDVVDDLTAGLGLPTDTENLDDGLNAVTTDVEDLLTGEQSLEQVVGSLLGGEPDEAITAGSVDQVVDGATDVVDDLTAGLGLPTDTENLDDGLNAVTTDVEDLLTGEQSLEQVVGSLLGGEPDEAITAGSVDQVVDGATDVVDDLTAGLGLPTDTENLDDGLNAVTTDVEDLLLGNQDLGSAVGSLLGGDSDQGTAGSVDQLADGVTDTLDDVLGTDTESLDNLVNDVTSLVSDLLGGVLPESEADGANTTTSISNDLLSLNLLTSSDEGGLL
ncbi:Retention module-containing protein [uncultured Thiomicrorhabdus sp.]